MWLIWTGLAGLSFATIGLLWFYHDYSLWRATHQPAIDAGWDIELRLPVFPRLLALVGLWLMAMTWVTICGKLLMRLWRLIKTG
jgi:hypothetical protein